MNFPYFKANTLDDVMHDVIKAIIDHGDRIESSKGDNLELRGLMLEILNPRARLSRTESRGKMFSCLGELCWYLSGSDDLDFISYYIPEYPKFADGSGAYGPRLLNCRGHNQLQNVVKLLKRKTLSRQAAIQLFQAEDIAKNSKDVPCTCTLQFLVRDKTLHMITYMRSNDVYLGLPHDIFSFTMIQEIIACQLKVKLGTYKHIVGSLHLYDINRDGADHYLREGYQPTNRAMPSMPTQALCPSIKRFLETEYALRNEISVDYNKLEDKLDPYWYDLIRLLQVFRFRKEGNKNNQENIEQTFNLMSSPIYAIYNI